MFEIKKNRKGEFYAEVGVRNGNTLFKTSESYTRKHNVKKAIRALLQLIYAPVYKVCVIDRTGKVEKKYWLTNK